MKSDSSLTCSKREDYRTKTKGERDSLSTMKEAENGLTAEK